MRLPLWLLQRLWQPLAQHAHQLPVALQIVATPLLLRPVVDRLLLPSSTACEQLCCGCQVLRRLLVLL